MFLFLSKVASKTVGNVEHPFLEETMTIIKLSWDWQIIFWAETDGSILYSFYTQRLLPSHWESSKDSEVFDFTISPCLAVTMFKGKVCSVSPEHFFVVKNFALRAKKRGMGHWPQMSRTLPKNVVYGLGGYLGPLLGGAISAVKNCSKLYVIRNGQHPLWLGKNITIVPSAHPPPCTSWCPGLGLILVSS